MKFGNVKERKSINAMCRLELRLISQNYNKILTSYNVWFQIINEKYQFSTAQLANKVLST